MFALLIQPRLMPIQLRRGALLLLLCTFAACSRSDRRVMTGESPPKAAARDSGDVERPLWEFGEGSTRTDSLPAEQADSLRDWGDYNAGENPVAYTVDLNGDGRPEWMVRSRDCGPFGGCPVKILTRESGGRLVTVMDGLARDIMVTNRMVNGWPVVWIYLGGVDGGVFREAYRQGSYEPAGTLLLRRDTKEWTETDYDTNAVWRRIQGVPVR